jgi:hypothetical protein
VNVFPILYTLGLLSTKSEPITPAHEIERLRVENDQLKTILRHLLSEKSAQYFICSGSTELDCDGLQKTILVRPLFGVEGAAIYTQTNPYSAQGW